MYGLKEVVPDPETLLALEPPELAWIVLKLLRERRDAICPHNHILEVRNEQNPSRAYPQSSLSAIETALAEAFHWLDTEGLLVDRPSDYGGSWRVLSRRALALQTDESFAQYVKAKELNPRSLHPTIRKDVWLAFLRGNYPAAVFEAMRAVEVAVRDASGAEQKVVGTKLMGLAFGNGGALRDKGADAAEEDGLMHLFMGAMGSYKNPHSHRNVPLTDAGEATEIVMLASHLLRIVDSRKTTVI